MPRYEFKVIPAPRRGEKARGLKTTEDRFAHVLTGLMNELGAEGWDYVRADTLPVDERSGLTGTKTTFQNMLVFRRVLEAEADVAPPVSLSSAPTAYEPPLQEPVFVASRRIGPAENISGLAPKLGPANPNVAAE